MNIKRAKEEIKNTIEAYLTRDEFGIYAIPAIRQRPVLLIGPPGVGKTQIMEQISQECQIGLVAYTITHHTRQSAIGLPFIQERVYGDRRYSITEYTMSEIVAAIYDKIEQTGLREGILFIDEINCVSETLAPTMLQFLQCKTFGNHKIPSGWIIVAAGNPPEYNKSVRDFDIVTLDRIKLIYVEADYEVWREYALMVEIHPAIVSYLDVKKQYFCRIETTVDGKMFATPRGWEDMSRLIEVYEKLKKPVDRDVVFQYIQHGKMAKDFANYLELYYKYKDDYRVDEILSGVIREAVCDKLARAPFDERVSVMSLLSAKLNSVFKEVLEQAELLERVMGLLKQMEPEGGTDAQTKGALEPALQGGEGQEQALQGSGAPNPLGAVSFTDAAERLEAIVTGVTVERNLKKESGLLSQGEDRFCQKLSKVLEGYLRTLKSECLREEKQVWSRLKELFGGDSASYEMSFKEAGQKLECAFDFMEAAFGNSQEMVVFVTGLNTGYYSVSFLQDYRCERYYQYNKNLLFDDRERELLSKIQQ